MARGSTAMILVAMLATMTTIADSSPLDPPDDVVFARQARGLLLRSWRTVQQLGAQYNSRRHQYDVSPERHGSAHVRLGTVHGGERTYHEPADQSLHDKRTPPGKNFLGMRGKKSAPLEEPTPLHHQLDEPLFDPDYYAEYSYYDDYDEPQQPSHSQHELAERRLLKSLMPKNKKMDSHTFLGMRGKKVSLIKQTEFSKKMMPGSQQFMGMRGKRAGAHV